MRSAVFVMAVMLLGSTAAGGGSCRDGITLPNPPVVKTEPVVDEYMSAVAGVPTKITDPYRWLEDAHSPRRELTSRRQNTYTGAVFSLR